MFEGDLLFEPLARAPYAHDASLYEIDPLGVVVPRSREDLEAALKYAAEHALPVHARGAGTGLAGESLGPGLVVDFSVHFRRILDVGAESVTVQAGVVLDVLNDHLAPLGRRIGPDPSGSAAATIGGLVAGDAAGARSLRHGTFGDHVERLGVLFAGGETGELGRVPWPRFDDDPSDFLGRLAHKVGALLTRHAVLIERAAPKSPRNRCGYALRGAAEADGIDLARLVVGSEGTLVLVTDATLKTVPIPPAQAAVFLPFGRLADAAMAVMDCLESGPTACELLDWRSLRLVRDGVPGCRDWVPADAEAALVVEFEGDDPAAVARRARDLARRVERGGKLAGAPVEAGRRADCERLLHLREAVRPLLLRMRGPARAVPVIEDAAAPPEALPELLAQIQKIFKSFDVNWLLNAHAGAGQLHFRPFLDMADERDKAKLEPLAVEVHEAVLAAGGTVSGEHGCGLSRSQFVRRQYGELAAVFREVKYAFDPQNLLNPGKVVGDDPHLMTRDLKALPARVADGPAIGLLPILDHPLRWPDRGRDEHILACNGCGACRSREPTLRMCPIFRANGAEAASPRAKVNVLRQIAAGVLDVKTWGTEDLKGVADLCVHCHLCRPECPAGVDVSTLMIEAKAAYVEAHGLGLSDWAFARLDLWAGIASRFPRVVNAMLSSRPARWFLERVFDLAGPRRLPRAHRRPFVRRAERSGLTTPRPHEPGPRVAYFVDVFANHFDQELAESVVAVLRLAGVNVYVPRKQRGCGMPALVAGDIEHAREIALANLRVLGDAVRDGYTVVCSEPTATLMIKHEYLKLTDDLDAGLVADATMDVGQYLAGLATRGQLPSPSTPLHAKVGYHQPCHLRALDVGTPGLDLIRAIPGLDVEFIDRGCSGIAGTYGLARRNFRTSLRAGRGLRRRLRDDDIELGSTECGTCRMQMEQGLPKRTLHPLKLLALAHGLNPSLRHRFKDPKPKHALS
jgi:FAD/FMN-containing dehydrogenase/Fe-S oxidoreductase